MTEIETAGALWVKPDDLGLQAKLAEWDGEIILSPPLDRGTGTASRRGASRRRWRRCR